MRTAKEILRDIITDVNAMRDTSQIVGADWFGPLQTEGDYVNWPNLDLLVKEAETALKGTNEKDK